VQAFQLVQRFLVIAGSALQLFNLLFNALQFRMCVGSSYHKLIVSLVWG